MRGRVFGGVVAVALLGCADVESPSEPIVVPIYETRQPATHSMSWQTMPTGAQEVPARQTIARGHALFKLSADGRELQYQLYVERIDNVLQAHIHMAAPGVNGGIVTWLYPPAPPLQLIPGRTHGLLAAGVIRDANVINALAGQGLAGLVAQLRAGNTYVNVHTTQFPGGEIRGQLPGDAVSAP